MRYIFYNQYIEYRKNKTDRIIYTFDGIPIKTGLVDDDMKIGRITVLFIFVAVLLTTAAYAAEANFTASSLTANDVDCRKCHTESPHVIHANKPVECVNCHGDKLQVSIPQCTKCHNGPIHQVHAGKVATQTCSYCHKTITPIHNNLLSGAVCSHCHKDLIAVHGNDQACVKCHKSPPNIVKPVKAQGMTLICQDCHTSSSVASIHGTADNKTACYNCHKGTSNAVGSEVPHLIHANIVDCKSCHQENGQVVVPQCTRCHDIEALHAFNKIGTLTSQSGLKCSVCHASETQLSGIKSTPAVTPTSISTITETAIVDITPQTPDAPSTRMPGFEIAYAIGILVIGYVLRKH